MSDGNLNSEFADFARRLLASQRALDEQMRPMRELQAGFGRQAEITQRIARAFEEQSARIDSVVRHVSETMAAFHVPAEALRAMNSLTFPDYAHQLGLQQEEINQRIRQVFEQMQRVQVLRPPDIYIETFLEGIRASEATREARTEGTAAEVVVRAHTAAAARAGIGPVAWAILLGMFGYLLTLYTGHQSSTEHEDLGLHLHRIQEILSEVEETQSEIMQQLHVEYEGLALVAFEDLKLHSQPDAASEVTGAVAAGDPLSLIQWGQEWALVRVQLNDRSITGWVKSSSVALETER